MTKCISGNAKDTCLSFEAQRENALYLFAHVALRIEANGLFTVRIKLRLRRKFTIDHNPKWVTCLALQTPLIHEGRTHCHLSSARHRKLLWWPLGVSRRLETG